VTRELLAFKVLVKDSEVIAEQLNLLLNIVVQRVVSFQFRDATLLIGCREIVVASKRKNESCDLRHSFEKGNG
jgi:hypothetical protein